MQETRKQRIWLLIVLFAITLGLVAYFLIMTVFIPVSRYSIKVPEEVVNSGKTPRNEEKWLLAVDDSLKDKAIDIVNRRSFLLSRLKLTKIDSISLVISLSDSSVSLVVQGITIYSSKIQSYKRSNIFKKTDPFVLAQWLSSPFEVTTHLASIPQVPVLYKKAPKDTIEAMSQLELDPLKDDIDPVYFRLNLGQELTLAFEQSEIPEKGTTKPLKTYNKQMREIRRKDIFTHLIKFKPIEFIPEISIVIDKKAARVIYRALPVDALVAIRL